MDIDSDIDSNIDSDIDSDRAALPGDGAGTLEDAGAALRDSNIDSKRLGL